MADGLLLSDDLIFTSRIVGTGRALGLTVTAARTLADLERGLDTGPSCVILDLQHPDLRTLDIVARCKQLGARVVAYGSHVKADVLHAARLAGCDVVLPRSKFVEDLPSELPTWMRRDEPV